MSLVRVMVVEDSLSVREMLTAVISRDPRLELVSVVASGEEALSRLHRAAPDVISLDIRLPGINGFETTLRIMSERPTPIVVVAGDIEGDELNISMNALRAGALSVVEKPVGLDNARFEQVAQRICDQLFTMSSVKVVKQRVRRDLDFIKSEKHLTSAPSYFWQPGQFKMLGVVASTGGPNALMQLFQSLPVDFPLPILLVQHITPSFLDSFVTWLSSSCPFTAVVAKQGELPQAGKIYLAPVEHHLELRGSTLHLTTSEPVSSQRPSGTVLLKSMAQSLGSGALATVLTGMGDDGAHGLLKVRQAGGYTLAESESTCVVYGMPAVAVQLGAACESLPIDQMGARVIEILSEVGLKRGLS